MARRLFAEVVEESRVTRDMQGGKSPAHRKQDRLAVFNPLPRLQDVLGETVECK